MSLTTPAHSELAYSLTKHYFGDPIALVVKTLFKFDQATLKTLKYSLNQVKINDLKKSLLILVKYQLVDYVKTVKNSNEQYEYSVVPGRVFSFFRMSRFIHTTNSTGEDGPTAGIMLSNLAKRALVHKDLLLRVSPSDKNEALIEGLISKRWIVRTGQDNLCLNIEKFDRNHRDNLVVEAIHDYYNREKKIKSLCQALMDLSLENTADEAQITAPIPLSELLTVLAPKEFASKDEIEKFLAALTSESNNRFIVNSGTHPNKGAMYAINVGLVIDYLVKEHLSSVVTTRFGPKCCRVFRVLLLRGPLLLKQIEELIMLPARDVREYSYMLIKEGFIRNRQVPKTPDNAPGKSVFIMSVELDQVVFGATDLCCRSMSNLLKRHESEVHKNKSLLERSRAVEELIGSSAATNDDWNQYFSGHELFQLDQINRTLERILLAKAQVDETLFLLHTWSKIR